MSAQPSADYSDQPIYLQHPGAAATILTLVISFTFIYLVASAYHGPAGGHGASHGAAPGASGSAAPAASAAPKH